MLKLAASQLAAPVRSIYSISRLTELRSTIVNVIERPSQEAERRNGRRHGDEYAYIFLVHVPCVSAPTSNITRHRPAKGTALGL